MVLKRAVILQNYYMPNGLTSLIYKKSTKFSGMLGEDEKIITRKILLKKFKERRSKVKKTLLPGSG